MYNFNISHTLHKMPIKRSRRIWTSHSKMAHCCLPQCSNNWCSSKSTDVAFHVFPTVFQWTTTKQKGKQPATRQALPSPPPQKKQRLSDDSTCKWMSLFICCYVFCRQIGSTPGEQYKSGLYKYERRVECKQQADEMLYG